jgi:hypothetical protein
MLSQDYRDGEDAGRTFARSLPPMPADVRAAFDRYCSEGGNAEHVEPVCDWLDTFPAERDPRYLNDDDFQDGYMWETLETLYANPED